MMPDRRTFIAGALGSALVPLSGVRATAQGKTHQISIRDFAFEPAVLEVQIGDLIRFTNHDLAPHTATAEDGSWDTETLAQGDSIDLAVTADWSENYFCAFHPAMTARLRIG